MPVRDERFLRNPGSTDTGIGAFKNSATQRREMVTKALSSFTDMTTKVGENRNAELMNILNRDILAATQGARTAEEARQRGLGVLAGVDNPKLDISSAMDLLNKASTQQSANRQGAAAAGVNEGRAALIQKALPFENRRLQQNEELGDLNIEQKTLTNEGLEYAARKTKSTDAINQFATEFFGRALGPDTELDQLSGKMEDFIPALQKAGIDLIGLTQSDFYKKYDGHLDNLLQAIETESANQLGYLRTASNVQSSLNDTDFVFDPSSGYLGLPGLRPLGEGEKRQKIGSGANYDTLFLNAVRAKGEPYKGSRPMFDTSGDNKSNNVNNRYIDQIKGVFDDQNFAVAMISDAKEALGPGAKATDILKLAATNAQDWIRDVRQAGTVGVENYQNFDRTRQQSTRPETLSQLTPGTPEAAEAAVEAIRTEQAQNEAATKAREEELAELTRRAEQGDPQATVAVTAANLDETLANLRTQTQSHINDLLDQGQDALVKQLDEVSDLTSSAGPLTGAYLTGTGRNPQEAISRIKGNQAKRDQDLRNAHTEAVGAVENYQQLIQDPESLKQPNAIRRAKRQAEVAQQNLDRVLRSYAELLPSNEENQAAIEESLRLIREATQ